jgi:hypothetical protein
MARLDFRGAAAKCTVPAGMTDSVLTVTLDGDVSNWPTGSSGRSFVVILDRGSAGEMEKVLCSALTGSVLTISQRGYDGTTAISHNAGATAEHGLSAGVLDDLSAHVYDVNRDDHSQYLRTDGANPPTDLSLLTQAPVSVGTANAEGTVDLFARADHVHDIADNAVGTAQIANDSVTADKIASDAVGTGEIAPDAVTSSEIAADAVGTAEIANSAVTAATIVTTGLYHKGTYSGNCNASGVYTFAHGAAFTPSAVFFQQITPLSGANRAFPVASGVDATNLQITMMLIAGSVNGLAISGFYFCVA